VKTGLCIDGAKAQVMANPFCCSFVEINYSCIYMKAGVICGRQLSGAAYGDSDLMGDKNNDF